jgi:hypothetical protein
MLVAFVVNMVVKVSIAGFAAAVASSRWSGPARRHDRRRDRRLSPDLM